MTDRATEIRGAVERRGISEFEIRSTASGLLHFTGHASVFDHPYEVHDRFGTFTETITRNAFSRTLSRGPDVFFYINHAGLPIARTASGTMRLSTDERGLYVEADLEPRDPDVQSVQYKLERGDMTDMSFAFRVPENGDTWNDDATARQINEVNLHHGDVSIVTVGANPAASATPFRMADALTAIASRTLAECRSEEDLDMEQVAAVHEILGEILTPEVPSRKTMSVRAALRALELD